MDREEIIRTLMGTTVHVTVDRPLGYRHGDLLYPINYGYIPGVMAPDGEEQDAYILGADTPLEHFRGRVIGAVRRLDDREDKLVVAPEGMLFHQGEIARAVRFQEQYFTVTIDSLLRKSCGVIPWRRAGAGLEYLVVLQTNRCWSFPKGHMEAYETEEETALRELREETGLKARLERDKRVVSRYPVSAGIQKELVLFPGEARGRIIPQKKEVLDYRWVTAQALKSLLHPDTCNSIKNILRDMERTEDHG